MNTSDIVKMCFLIIFLLVVMVPTLYGIMRAKRDTKKRYNHMLCNLKDEIQSYKTIIKNDSELIELRKKVNKVFVKNVDLELYKSTLVKKILNNYDSSLIYDINLGINENDYRLAGFKDSNSYQFYSSRKSSLKGNSIIASGRLNDSLEVYISDNAVRGKISDKDYIIANVALFNKRDNARNINFNGPVAILDLNKNVDFNLSVIDNRLKINDDNYVEIDNPSFEQYYDVFTTDKVKTMQLLTPSLTTKILDLLKKYNFYFEIKIIHNKIYLRFYTDEFLCFNLRKIEDQAINLVMNINIINGIKDIFSELLKEIER